jgi:hypothetical protein
MKALSFLQPWGWLVASGHKLVENRKRNTKSRGETIAIHISRGTPLAYFDDAKRWLDAHGLGHVVPLIPSIGSIGHGGIVGTFEISAVLPPDVVPGMFSGIAPDITNAPPLRWWMRDQYGYIVGKATHHELVRCSGALGFWNVPAEIEERLRAARPISQPEAAE